LFPLPTVAPLFRNRTKLTSRTPPKGRWQMSNLGFVFMSIMLPLWSHVKIIKLSPIVFNQLHHCLCLHANNVCYSINLAVRVPRDVVFNRIQSLSLSFSNQQLCFSKEKPLQYVTQISKIATLENSDLFRFYYATYSAALIFFSTILYCETTVICSIAILNNHGFSLKSCYVYGPYRY